MKNKTAIIGFAAFSGTGKTTLLTQLIRLFKQQGLRIAVIKHSHHDFEIDQPGKDSYELHHAGSSQTLLTSKYRRALITENHALDEPSLDQSTQQIDLENIDLVMVEGFRHEEGLKRIELHRPSLGKPLLYPEHKGIIAIASDEPIPTDIPLLDLNKPAQIAQFITQYLNLDKS